MGKMKKPRYRVPLQWRLAPAEDQIDKAIVIDGPGMLRLELDCDEAPEEAEASLPRILRALNAEWNGAKGSCAR